MFVGHCGVSLAVKRTDARLSSRGYSWPYVSSLGSFVVMTKVGVCLDQKLTASFSSRPRHELLFLESDHG